MISVKHLTKHYGDCVAVNDLSFTISEGHVYGFLGPNGAGKSTTMNIITGCLSPTEGTVTINNYDVFEQPNEAKKCIGYLPEQPPLYMNETPKEFLKFVGEAKGLRGQELNEQILQVMEQTKITNVQNKRIAALSKGYKQRVGIAQALIGNPKVIILDEPTVGLDPIQIIEIRALIKELGKTHTVIFSSHILSEVQTICDEILIISNGQLVAYDTPEALENMMISSNEIIFTCEVNEARIKQILQNVENIDNVTATSLEGDVWQCHVQTLHSDTKALCKQIFFAFADDKTPLLEMSVKKTCLEDVFIELTEQAEKTLAEQIDENDALVDIESEEII